MPEPPALRQLELRLTHQLFKRLKLSCCTAPEERLAGSAVLGSCRGGMVEPGGGHHILNRHIAKAVNGLAQRLWQPVNKAANIFVAVARRMVAGVMMRGSKIPGRQTDRHTIFRNLRHRAKVNIKRLYLGGGFAGHGNKRNAKRVKAVQRRLGRAVIIVLMIKQASIKIGKDDHKLVRQGGEWFGNGSSPQSQAVSAISYIIFAPALGCKFYT